jgi:LysR family transcriptional regulator (chromosome initiation inhibitor)
MQYLKCAQLLETDLATELALQQDAPLRLVLALNADTMGTWFFPALSTILSRENVLLDLTVEDQGHTYTLLESGMAIACISTEPKLMHGCTAELLGVMRYWLLSTNAFRQRWFAEGLTRDAARSAPIIAHTHKGTLQSSFLLNNLGLQEGAYPCHYIPGAHSHFNAVRHGLGYGVVPELLRNTESDPMISLAPNHQTDVALYFHTWKVQSPRMEYLEQQVIAAARAVLQ